MCLTTRSCCLVPESHRREVQVDGHRHLSWSTYSPPRGGKSTQVRRRQEHVIDTFGHVDLREKGYIK